MAEDLTQYMKDVGIRVRYLHSDIDTLERAEIIRDMRLDVFDAVSYTHLYLNFLAIRNVSGTTAIRTFIFDDLTCTMTIRTHLNVTNHAKHGLLGVNNLTFTITFRTGNR